MINYTIIPKMTSNNIEMPFDVIIYGSIFYPIIFLIGITGNLLVIYVLLKEKQLRSFTNYLLANLSFADLMVLFTCVPSAFHDLFAKERWYLGKIACYLVTFIENCMGIASILSIFMITFERYYVICRPLNVKSLITKSHILKLIFSIWIISITFNLPFIYLTEYKLAKFFDKNSIEYKCVAKTTMNHWSLYYTVIVNFFIYLVIGVVLIIMYYEISKYLKKSNKLLRKNLTNTAESNGSNELIVLVSLNKENRKFSDSLLFKSNSFKTPQNLPCSSSVQNRNCIGGSSSSQQFILDRYIIPRKQLIYMIMCVIVIFYVSLFPLKIWTLLLMFFGHNPAFPRIINLRAYW
jgi:hypothetical protein